MAFLSACATNSGAEEASLADDGITLARVMLPPSKRERAVVPVPRLAPRAHPEEPRPRRRYAHVADGTASWYGPGFDGRKTANGERFDQSAMTAAHPDLPFASTVRVTRVDTGDSVLVRINDRGPYADDRVIDLSRAAAAELGFIADGVAEVRVELVEQAVPVDDPSLNAAARSRLVSVETLTRTGGAAGRP